LEKNIKNVKTRFFYFEIKNVKNVFTSMPSSDRHKTWDEQLFRGLYLDFQMWERLDCVGGQAHA